MIQSLLGLHNLLLGADSLLRMLGLLSDLLMFLIVLMACRLAGVLCLKVGISRFEFGILGS